MFTLLKINAQRYRIVLEQLRTTQFIGKELLTFDSVDSTNELAKELIRERKLKNGTAIFAASQPAGKGQNGSDWLSQPGKNVILSILLCPNFLVPKQSFYLQMAISLGVKNYVEQATNQTCELKWPNDVYHQDKKLGGILIENTFNPQTILSSVVGIGLNINQILFPLEIEGKATSIKAITGKTTLIPLALEHLCCCIETSYAELAQGMLDNIKVRYLNALYRFQEKHLFKAKDKVFEGMIVGISDEGNLVMEQQGQLCQYGIKEVGYL